MSSSSPVFVRRTSPRQQTTSCCGGSRRQKVAPSLSHHPDYHIAEVRPNRHLRIRHVNPADDNKNRKKSNVQLMEETGADHNFRHKNELNGGVVGKDPHRDQDVGGTDTKRDRTTTAASINVTIDGNPGSNPAPSLRALPAPSERQEMPLFMIHGVGGSSDVWQAQMDYFGEQGFEVIAPDIIGHGFSCAPSDSKAYHFKEIVEDLLKIFDGYSKAQNIVIGHSYGASFAAVLSRRRPRQVSKLILISGGSPTPLAPQPGLFTFPTCLLACCKPVLTRGFNKSAFHATKTYIPRERAFDVPTSVLKHTMNGQVWLEGTPDYHKLIGCPTLLIHGRHDQLVSVEDEEEMTEAIEDCILMVLEDTSHMVMIEQPDKVNALIHEFININRWQVTASNQQTTYSKSSAQATPRGSNAATPRKPWSGGRNRSNSTLSLRSVKSIPNNLVANNLK